MVQVQRHECRPKKCFGKCEEGDPKVCRYGYPRERCDEDLGRSETTGRYIYRCEDKEDIDGSAMYCVPCFARSDKTRPVVIDWTLPDKHGQPIACCCEV